MLDDQQLTPSSHDDLKQALAHALRFDGRRQFNTSGEMMAKITAAHLAEQLRISGFVLMKRPPPDPSKSMPWGPPKLGEKS